MRGGIAECQTDGEKLKYRSEVEKVNTGQCRAHGASQTHAPAHLLCRHRPLPLPSTLPSPLASGPASGGGSAAAAAAWRERRSHCCRE